MANEQVFVTGGSGFIGAHCILQLLIAGYRVRTTVRSLKRESDVRAMLKVGGVGQSIRDPGDRLSFAVADLVNDEGWPQAVAGCDYVLHVASPLPPSAPKHEDDLIIPARDGALRVLRAARDAGVRRVVLTSSFAAIGYGHPPQATPFTEYDWSDLNGDVPAYQKSKTLAERAAWDFVAREGSGLELAVINPVGVLGPVLGPDYSPSIFLVQRLMDGAMPGCPRLNLGLVDVRDVTDLHLRAMTHPAAKENVSSPPPATSCGCAISHASSKAVWALRQIACPPRAPKLSGAPRCIPRPGSQTDHTRARQRKERDQRKGQAHVGLVTAHQ